MAFDINYFNYSAYLHLRQLSERYGPVDKDLYLRLSTAASGGDHQAMRELHYLCRTGKHGVPVDPGKAVGFLRKVYQDGEATAEDMYLFGRALELGDTVEKDVSQAFFVYQKASELGHRASGLLLANYYRCGYSGVVEKNVSEAERLYRLVLSQTYAVAGSSPIETLLNEHHCRGPSGWKYSPVDGFCYHGLFLLERQPTHALVCLEKAANAGLPEPQTILGLHFIHGSGPCHRDVHSGRYWLSEAAKAGSDHARNALLALEPDVDQSQNQHQDVLANMVKYSVESTSQSPIQLEIRGNNPINDIMLKQDPDSRKFIQYLAFALKKWDEELANEGKDPTSVYKVKRSLFRNDMVHYYATVVKSPTARYFLETLEVFERAFSKLEMPGAGDRYTDPAGVELWLRGMLQEATLVNYFLFDYHKLQLLIDNSVAKEPSNLVLKAAQLKFKSRTSAIGQAEDNLEEKIRRNEIYVHQLEKKMAPSRFENEILYNCLCYLGSLYHITHQRYRSLHTFEKSLKLKPECPEALYAVAYSLLLNNVEELDKETRMPPDDSGMKGEVQRGFALLKEYLSRAPPCDKKYVNAHILLAQFYLVYEKDKKSFLKYFDGATEARQDVLPFMNEQTLPVEDWLSKIYPNIRMTTCFFSECTNTAHVQLKTCTKCKTARYCQRECQGKDWTRHKKTCKLIVGGDVKGKKCRLEQHCNLSI